MGVVILVPVFAPRRDLERAEPPNIDAGIAFLGFAEMREAVHEALHMEGVDKAHGAHPEEAHPPKTKNYADEYGENDDWSFRKTPKPVNAASQLGSPALFVSGRGLVKPAEVSPPETALLGTGNVVGGIGDRVMKSMIGYPTGWMSGAIEHSPEDQELFNKTVHSESLVSQKAVVANGGTEATEGDKQKSKAENFKTGNREKN